MLKIPWTLLFSALIFLLPFPADADFLDYRDDPQIDHMLSVGVRQHVNHSEFDKLAFGEDDLAYILAYEAHEDIGFWQLGIGYTPDPSGDQPVDYILTPQISLIFKDRIYRAGIGVLWDYIVSNQDDIDDKWSSLYWQFIIGIHIPFSKKVGLDINSYYAFEKWNKLGDIHTKDIEFGALLNFSF
jgi:hypothetical protein